MPDVRSSMRMPHRLTFAVCLLLWAPSAAFAQAAPPTPAQVEARRERVYLSELGLLIDVSRRLMSFTETNLDERDLLKFAGPIAERYVEVASHLVPTVKLAVVHPHLLLVIENLERALDAAAASDHGVYQKRMRIARDELANLEAVLKQLKLRVPEGIR